MKKEDNFWIFVGLGFNLLDSTLLSQGFYFCVEWPNYER